MIAAAAARCQRPQKGRRPGGFGVAQLSSFSHRAWSVCQPAHTQQAGEGLYIRNDPMVLVQAMGLHPKHFPDSSPVVLVALKAHGDFRNASRLHFVTARGRLLIYFCVLDTIIVLLASLSDVINH